MKVGEQNMGEGAKPCSIRIAGEPDIESLAEMALSLQVHVETSNPGIWRLNDIGRREIRVEMIRLLSDPEAQVLVAVDTMDKAVGFAIGRVLHRDKYDLKTVGSIERIFVKEECRRCGLGKKLVMGLCNLFEERGANEITLRYVIGNEEGERFWKGLGFKAKIEVAGINRRALVKNLES